MDEVKVEDGLRMVKIKTVVRQRGVEESFHLGWIGWIVVILIALLLCKVHPVLGVIFFIIALIVGC